MTKEEILRNKGEAWEYSNTTQVSPVLSVYKAMEEYAEQQCIAFWRWYQRSEYSGYCKTHDASDSKTIQEVYQLFRNNQSLVNKTSQI